MRCHNPLTLPQGIVPCGKCIPCMIRWQTDWVCRMLAEYKDSTCAHFITLTYADEYVPTRTLNTVPSRKVNVLHKPDVQKFMKRLRADIYPHKVRYFLCGEYGPKTHRPHYHLILFNYPTEQYDIFTKLPDYWKQGYTVVRVVNPNHFRYVAKYCASAAELPRHLRNKEVRPFITCSRRPGIGNNFLTPAMRDYYRTNLETIMRIHGVTYSLPRYYRNLLFDSDMRETIKERLEEYHYHHSSVEIEKYTSIRDIIWNDITYPEQVKFEFDRRYKDRLYKTSVL